MSSAWPTRKKSWWTVAASLATLLALLVTPLCAPLCAAQMCLQTAPAIAAEGHCHAAASLHGGGHQIHAALNCNSPELAVATLSAENKGDVLRRSRSAWQAASHVEASEEFDPSFAASQKNLASSPGPLRLSDSFPAPSVLRL